MSGLKVDHLKLKANYRFDMVSKQTNGAPIYAVQGAY